MSSFHSVESIDINTMLDLLERRLDDRIDNSYSELKVAIRVLRGEINNFIRVLNNRLVVTENTLIKLVEILNQKFNTKVKMKPMSETVANMYIGGSKKKSKRRRNSRRKTRRA